MAIDTRLKRSSAMNLLSPWRGVLPAPDSSINAADRAVVLLLYSGLVPSGISDRGQLPVFATIDAVGTVAPLATLAINPPLATMAISPHLSTLEIDAPLATINFAPPLASLCVRLGSMTICCQDKPSTDFRVAPIPQHRTVDLLFTIWTDADTLFTIASDDKFRFKVWSYVESTDTFTNHLDLLEGTDSDNDSQITKNTTTSVVTVRISQDEFSSLTPGRYFAELDIILDGDSLTSGEKVIKQVGDGFINLKRTGAGSQLPS